MLHGTSMSLLLLPSAASLDFSGEVFPFTAACFCAGSVSAAVSPFTTSPASVAAVAAVSPCRDCVGVSCCVAVLAPLPRLLRTLGWRLCAGWVGVVEPEPGVVEPRLLGVGVVRAELLVSAVTGVETVLSCEITDCCELRLGERCVLETSSVPSSCNTELSLLYRSFIAMVQIRLMVILKAEQIIPKHVLFLFWLI